MFTTSRSGGHLRGRRGSHTVEPLRGRHFAAGGGAASGLPLGRDDPAPGPHRRRRCRGSRTSRTRTPTTSSSCSSRKVGPQVTLMANAGGSTDLGIPAVSADLRRRGRPGPARRVGLDARRLPAGGLRHRQPAARRRRRRSPATPRSRCSTVSRRSRLVSCMPSTTTARPSPGPSCLAPTDHLRDDAVPLGALRSPVSGPSRTSTSRSTASPATTRTTSSCCSSARPGTQATLMSDAGGTNGSGPHRADLRRRGGRRRARRRAIGRSAAVGDLPADERR